MGSHWSAIVGVRPMSLARKPPLSKTRFGAGLQCLKRLYLDCYARDLRDPISASQQARFDAGTAVGELARSRFPGGRLIAERYDEHPQALVSTSEALADQLVPAIYEAAFVFDGIRIRADILVRNSESSFDLVEVKSGTGVKKEHIPDTAIQLHVVEGSGLRVRKVFLLHIDSSYEYDGGWYDPGHLFHLEDITEQARDYLSSTVPDSLAGMWEALDQHEPPVIETGSHCKKPYTCPFYGHCHRDEPVHSIEQLPRVGRRLLGELKGSGIRDIRDIHPDTEGLSPTQQRVRDSVALGRPYVGNGLAMALSEITHPVYFLDFETLNPALPLYAGTRPYQQVPFQWSLHVLDSQGSLHHESFLQTGAGDPREGFSASLIEAVGPVGTVLVYTGFERTRIRELAAALPHHADQLLSIGDRFVDLHKILTDHYYHPEFHGSYSIKSVLPALVPGLGYDDLTIQDGEIASAAFARVIDSATAAADRVRLRGELMDYCRRDTEGMVRIFQVLNSL